MPPQRYSARADRFCGRARQGPADTLRGALRLLSAFWQCLRHVRAAQAPTWCSAWAAMSLSRRPDGVLLGKPLVLVKPNSVAAAGQPGVGRVADTRLRLPGDAAQDRPAASSPATRCAPRSKPGRAGRALRRAQRRRCGCWWSAAASGAQALNECVPEALALMPRGAAAAGHAPDRRRHLDELRAAYAAAGVEAECAVHRRHGRRASAECDVIVCRAGAITVARCAPPAWPRVLVPFVVSTDDAPARQRAMDGDARRRPSICRRPS